MVFVVLSHGENMGICGNWEYSLQPTFEASAIYSGGEAGQVCAQYGQAGLLERLGGSNNRGCRAGAYGLLFFLSFFLSFGGEWGGESGT